MRIIDCHCHLEAPEFDFDRDKVIQRAIDGKVVMICSGLGIEDSKKVLEISKKYDQVFATFGIEPYSKEPVDPVIDFIEQNREKIVGVGEVGLDFWWMKKDNLDQELMEQNFIRFIDLSKQLNLPVIVHSRSAGRRAIEILIEKGARKVMMHAFDGRAFHALKGVEQNFFFSIPPSVVRSEQKQKLVKAVPIENLVLETDSPVLGVDPKSRNEPLFVFESANKIAEIKGLALDKVIEVTTRNAKKLFQI